MGETDVELLECKVKLQAHVVDISRNSPALYMSDPKTVLGVIKNHFLEFLQRAGGAKGIISGERAIEAARVLCKL